MTELLTQNPFLTLFLVSALGYGLGQIKINGSRLGISAVLFVGLAFGAFVPDLDPPQEVFTLGLLLFIYTIGLENGTSFFRALTGKRSQQLWFVLFVQVVPLLLSVAVFFLFQLDADLTAGIYAGVATNAAALASLLDYLQGNAELLVGYTTDAIIIGFSICYPISILGRILVLNGMRAWWKIDYVAEAHALRDEYPAVQEVENRTISIENEAVAENPIRYLRDEYGWNVVFGRVYHRENQEIALVSGETTLQVGDLVNVGGPAEEIMKVADTLGQISTEDHVFDAKGFVRRRMFVSNPDVVGEKLATLNLRDQYGATVTRIQRGDNDLLATPDFVLELGDRVRVFARPRDIDPLTGLFGDSYTALSRFNILSLGLGLALGLMLGLIQITLPGGVTFALGFVGGPLIVSLILGSLRRTGPLVWTLPYTANQTLRQFGTALFLSVIGIQSGQGFLTILLDPLGLLLIGVAVGITSISMWLALMVGYRLLKIPFSLLSGMAASHPAVFSYAQELSGNQLPAVGYIFAVPVTLISRVIFAQLLFVLLA